MNEEDLTCNRKIHLNLLSRNFSIEILWNIRSVQEAFRQENSSVRTCNWMLECMIRSNSHKHHELKANRKLSNIGREKVVVSPYHLASSSLAGAAAAAAFRLAGAAAFLEKSATILDEPDEGAAAARAGAAALRRVPRISDAPREAAAVAAAMDAMVCGGRRGGSEGGINGGNGDCGGPTLDPCPRAVIGCEPTR